MPIIELIGSFFTSAGPGGITVILVIALAALVSFILIRWILQGEEVDKTRILKRNR